MRVVSQHGNVDLPYEEIVVLHVDRSVMAIHNGKEYTLGVYSSMEKSYKAMEMLREAYVGKIIIQGIDMGDEKKFANWLETWNMQAMVIPQSENTRIEHINNTVFQFPKDEEIEVENQQAVGKD